MFTDTVEEEYNAALQNGMSREQAITEIAHRHGRDYNNIETIVID